jgi:hypothetical protein
MRINSLFSFAILSILGMALAHQALANTTQQVQQADSSCYLITSSGKTIDLSKMCHKASESNKQLANPLQVIQDPTGKATPSEVWHLIPDGEPPMAGKTHAATTMEKGDKASGSYYSNDAK